MTIPAVRPSSLPRVAAQALGTLYDTYASRLFRLAYRLLGTREDAEDVVHDVFVALPEALRSVLVLKEMEGYSHAEIAALLGISAVTSRVRLYRAIKRVRQRMEDRP